MKKDATTTEGLWYLRTSTIITDALTIKTESLHDLYESLQKAANYVKELRDAGIELTWFPRDDETSPMEIALIESPSQIEYEFLTFDPELARKFGVLRNCHECEAKYGELHTRGCYYEECPYCSRLIAHCKCEASHGGGPPDEERVPHDGHPDSEVEVSHLNEDDAVDRSGEVHEHVVGPTQVNRTSASCE